jgi:phosphoserine phosphatase RsbU/P
MLRQRAGRFVTIAIARLQLERDGTVTATVACGGHPSPRILRATGLVETLGEPGTLLGVLGEVELYDRSARLAAGDALVLYTDGLIEARSPDGILGEERVRELLAREAGATADGLAARLAELAEAYSRLRRRDDLAVLIARVTP